MRHSKGRADFRWVKSGHDRADLQCPLYPQERTLLGANAMSAKCQKRTFCAAAEAELIDHLVGAGDRVGRASFKLKTDSRLPSPSTQRFGDLTRLH